LCDAIVMMDILARDERVPVAASLPIPVVLVGVPEDPAALFCVDLDFEAAARIAIDELVGTGHDEAVVVGFPSTMTQRGVNYVGRFLRAARGHAEARRLPLTVLDPLESTGMPAAKAVERLLAEGIPRRLGLLVPHSPVIGSLLHALRERGVVPGRDISFIGLSTDNQAEESHPPYTTISEEPRVVSRRAVETLFWLLDPTPGVDRPAIDLVAPRLVRRGTVMPGTRPVVELLATP
jgi:DNA-binding LacI/PurR family transcriptional regulator